MISPVPVMSYPEDRRIAPRLRPALGTTFRFDASYGKNGPASGLVWNISRSGVSMLLGVAPKAGEILAGELILESGPASLAVLLQVVHVKPVPTVDFMLGARFMRELSTEELGNFLDPNTSQ